MSTGTPPGEPLSRAEERLVALLVLLRGLPDDEDGTAVRRLMLAVRWHRVLRSALEAAGALASAVGEGLAILVGPRRREGGP